VNIVPGPFYERMDFIMARKANATKTEIVVNETTTTLAPVKKTATRKATTKAPEKELDWHAIGIVKEWQAARGRIARNQARAIERLRLEYLTYVFGAFCVGITAGIMVCSWLR